MLNENGNIILCQYGCGKEAMFPPTNGRTRYCCSHRVYMCPCATKKSLGIKSKCDNKEYRQKITERNKKVSKIPGFGEKISKSIKKVWDDPNSLMHGEERNKKLSISCSQAYINNPELREITSRTTKEGMKREFEKNPWKLEKIRETSRKRMSAGGAAYLNSFIKNPSKPQLKLFEVVKEIFSEAILNFPLLNYSVDIAIPNIKIAIEYDGGYWHKNTEEFDNKRQKQIENEGWKVLHYRGTLRRDELPSKQQIINDIEQALQMEIMVDA